MPGWSAVPGWSEALSWAGGAEVAGLTVVLGPVVSSEEEQAVAASSRPVATAVATAKDFTLPSPW